MNKLTIKDIAINAMIAAMYFTITYFTQSFAYLNIQFRIAEILLLLCFYNRKYVIGVTLGCLLANITSPLGWPDMVFGTLATLSSAILISYSKRLWLAGIWPVLLNGVVVGLELHILLELPFWISGLEVVAGELVVLVVGVIIFYFLQRYKGFLGAIDAKQNIPE